MKQTLETVNFIRLENIHKLIIVDKKVVLKFCANIS